VGKVRAEAIGTRQALAIPTAITANSPTTSNTQPMPRTKQTLRYQTKEDLWRIEDLLVRPTKEDTTVPPDTPTISDQVPTAVPSAAEIPIVVTTITNTGPTSITTIVENTGTTTTTIISTIVPGINIESRNTHHTTNVASTQLVIDIESDSDDKVEVTPDPKRAISFRPYLCGCNFHI
jgi:hypothetical protein